LLGRGCLIKPRDVLGLVFQRLDCSIAIADKLDPHLAVCGELPGLAFAHFDTIVEFLGDKWWFNAPGDLVDGDVAVWATFGWEGVAFLMGDQLCVY
jgi:hypothetical protein